MERFRWNNYGRDFDVARRIFQPDFQWMRLEEEPAGIAYEIHNAYNKIDMVKYVKLMEEILPPPPSPDLDFPEFHYTNTGLLEFINTEFTNFIHNSFNKADKTTYLPKWQAVREIGTLYCLRRSIIKITNWSNHTICFRTIR